MTERYIVVREDMLPEAIVKTLHAKELLTRDDELTVNEAVDRVGMSRSAFYKYKDGVFALNQLNRERIVTISLDLEHRSGVLSNVVSKVASMEGNVLTMHQTIPLQGFANVIISVDIAQMADGTVDLMNVLRQQPGVRKASIIGQG